MTTKIIDGHSHLFQVAQPVSKLKKSIKEIKDFDLKKTVAVFDRLDIELVQTMPQEMTRIMGQWLGSNDLSVAIRDACPERFLAFAAAEPVSPEDTFNRTRFEEVRTLVEQRKLGGILLTPPYGHYYANDRRVYPFYEMAIELDIPIYFHHSHMFGPSKYCPLKYARIYILDELTIDFPELRFNVEHMGYPWTEELLSIMARSPNVFTDIAMYLSPDPVMRGRPLMLARNLAMARDYNVLDRVFYGSDYDFDENIDGYAKHVTHEVTYLRERLPHDMEKLGYEPLSQDELDGLLRGNVLKLWNRPT